MAAENREYIREPFTDQGTGTARDAGDFVVVTCVFDRYEIKVKLTPTNQFVGIVEVKINKDFLSHRQRLGARNYLDVEEYYRE
ncbi:MAG: hypothetical protein AAB393_10230 [Bacteroidota bacterium]